MPDRLVEMPEKDVDEWPQVKFGPTSAKTVLEWGWKLILVLWMLFQFYSQQTAMVAKVSSEEKAIETLQKRCDELDRKVGDGLSEIKALHELQANDRAFYLQTQKR